MEIRGEAQSPTTVALLGDPTRMLPQETDVLLQNLA